MEATSTEVLSLRIEAGVAEMLRQLAGRWRLTEALTVERLIVEQMKAQALVSDSHPSVRMLELLTLIAKLLDEVGSGADEHITLNVFLWIAGDAAAAAAYRDALIPGPDSTPERRRQFVNQRIGRFIKEHTGRESGAELTLPREADELIKGYTLLPPSGTRPEPSSGGALGDGLPDVSKDNALERAAFEAVLRKWVTRVRPMTETGKSMWVKDGGECYRLNSDATREGVQRYLSLLDERKGVLAWYLGLSRNGVASKVVFGPERRAVMRFPLYRP